MVVDYTVTLGDIAQVTTLVVGGILTVLSLKSTVTVLKTDMADVKHQLRKVGEVLITLAVTTNRLENAEQDIRDLKHGRGFIAHHSDAGPGVNGEYT